MYVEQSENLDVLPTMTRFRMYKRETPEPNVDNNVRHRSGVAANSGITCCR